MGEGFPFADSFEEAVPVLVPFAFFWVFQLSNSSFSSSFLHYLSLSFLCNYPFTFFPLFFFPNPLLFRVFPISTSIFFPFTPFFLLLLFHVPPIFCFFFSVYIAYSSYPTLFFLWVSCNFLQIIFGNSIFVPFSFLGVALLFLSTFVEGSNSLIIQVNLLFSYNLWYIYIFSFPFYIMLVFLAYHFRFFFAFGAWECLQHSLKILN